MELDFDPQQQQIKDAARRFLERQCTPALVRQMREQACTFPDDTWKQMAELGWLGLPFDERHGGSQCDWVSLAAVVEELGRACDPTPFVDSVITCGWLLQDTASEAQLQRWMPPLIAGELKPALAMLEDGHGADACVSSLADSGEGLRLDGRKLFVEDAAERDQLLVTARHQGSGRLCLAMVAPDTRGVELIRLRSLAHPSLYEVVFDNVMLAPEQVIGPGANVASALDHAILRSEAFQSVAAAGGARRVLELGVAHARERQQFGKPIGSFQAVQHLLANAWIDVETAWLAAYEAITHCELGLPAAADRIAVARCVSNETFTRSCLTVHQVFGGMGFMWETDLHLWTRKAKQIELSYGGLARARARLAATL